MGIDVSKESGNLRKLTSILFRSRLELPELFAILIKQEEGYPEKTVAILQTLESYEGVKVVSELIVFVLVNDPENRKKWFNLFIETQKSNNHDNYWYYLGFVIALFRAGSQLFKDEEISTQIRMAILNQIFKNQKLFREINEKFDHSFVFNPYKKAIDDKLTGAIYEYFRRKGTKTKPDPDQMNNVNQLIFDINQHLRENENEELPRLATFMITQIFYGRVGNLTLVEMMSLLSHHAQQE